MLLLLMICNVTFIVLYLSLNNTLITKVMNLY